jgi:hypothetical protein
MPAPLVGAAALAAARILAGQIAKQTGKKLTQNQMKAVALKVASTKKGKVSAVAARRVAEQAAGPKAKTPTGRVPAKVSGQKVGPVIRITDKKTVVSTPMKRINKKEYKDGPVTKSYQTTRVTPADRREQISKERFERLTKALTPIKPRGIKSGGKTMVGPKASSRSVQVAKKGPSAERNKLVNPKDRSLDESRRVGMRNADSRNKTPKERELEQRPDLNRVSSPKPKDAAQREADKRVAEGLKKLNKGKKARPDFPKTKARAPKYPKSTAERFRRQTGGE